MGSMPFPYDVQPLYYGGRRHTTNSHFQTIDPAHDRPLADVCRVDAAHVDAAVASARAAFPSWAATPAIERARILQRAAALLRTRNDALATIETHDTGKAFSETSTVDVVTGADVLEFYASAVASGALNGETARLRGSAWVYTARAPLGVCAGIGAWNYPIQIALWKSAPCLAAGNCMVYKPSEFTPLHGLALAELYAEAGLPPGVFNVVHGAGDVGAVLTSHPGIAKVSFTGQVATGCKVAGSAAGTMKYVTMELGGKSPCVVLPDAPLEVAVDGAMMANFFSSGQVCTNGTRVFVPRSMLSAFEARLVEKMAHVRAGDLMDPATNFGPLVSRVHWEKVASYIRHGIEVDKARLVYGGFGMPSDLERRGADPRGFWVRPTVFSDCTDDMHIAQDEIFGPVMCILPYDDGDQSLRESSDGSDSEGLPAGAAWPAYLTELVRRANATPMGLAAGVFTRDLDLGHAVVQALEAGITWVNTWGESPADMSVGGWKMSGLGVENGRRGLDNWVQNKSTLIDMAGSVATAFSKL